ncbi:gastrula zinc finger protein XlCGF7.1-like isoform X1 [Ixodes scapularis]|uniref:gastrula zinc finger protein XlCGF7.1-like isoform X1 n=2 Tax=Ixodes scapularis TaxID=6945 RepID=UPI001C3899FC|nr:gastrula zinc finger protein XlCGF7.1-like isoform X1 [Ixodes scapularis]
MQLFFSFQGGNVSGQQAWMVNPHSRHFEAGIRATKHGPVLGAIKVEEEAPGCEDAEGKRSSKNDSLTVCQQMVHPHREKKYQCRYCPFSCSRSSGVKKHERTHTGEKPFSCNVCHKVFAEKGNLQVHKRIHTGEKPFRCQTCHMAFAGSTDLKRHNITVHTGDKPFRCGTCGAVFSRQFQLRCHEALHGGDPLFHCKWCGERFVQKTFLNAHKTEHHPRGTSAV